MRIVFFWNWLNLRLKASFLSLVFLTLFGSAADAGGFLILSRLSSSISNISGQITIFDKAAFDFTCTVLMLIVGSLARTGASFFSSCFSFGLAGRLSSSILYDAILKHRQINQNFKELQHLIVVSTKEFCYYIALPLAQAFVSAISALGILFGIYLGNPTSFFVIIIVIFLAAVAGYSMKNYSRTLGNSKNILQKSQSAMIQSVVGDFEFFSSSLRGAFVFNSYARLDRGLRSSQIGSTFMPYLSKGISELLALFVILLVSILSFALPNGSSIWSIADSFLAILALQRLSPMINAIVNSLLLVSAHKSVALDVSKRLSL